MAKATFDSFLKKMVDETDYKERELVAAPTSLAPSRQKIIEKREEKPVKKEVLSESKKEEVDESIVEKSLEYAATFIKLVKKNFSNTNDRKVVLEAVRNAVNIYLTESYGISTPVITESFRTEVRTAPTVAAKNKMPQRLQGSLAAMGSNEVEAAAEKYERDLPIVLKETEDGKAEVDLSMLSEQDYNDMRVLMGVGSKPQIQSQPQGPQNDGRTIKPVASTTNPYTQFPADDAENT